VEISQVERRVLGRTTVGRGKAKRAGAREHRQHGAIGREHRVDAAAQPEQAQVERKPPCVGAGLAADRLLQHRDGRLQPVAGDGGRVERQEGAGRAGPGAGKAHSWL